MQTFARENTRGSILAVKHVRIYFKRRSSELYNDTRFETPKFEEQLTRCTLMKYVIHLPLNKSYFVQQNVQVDTSHRCTSA